MPDRPQISGAQRASRANAALKERGDSFVWAVKKPKNGSQSGYMRVERTASKLAHQRGLHAYEKRSDATAHAKQLDYLRGRRSSGNARGAQLVAAAGTTKATLGRQHGPSRPKGPSKSVRRQDSLHSGGLFGYSEMVELSRKRKSTRPQSSVPKRSGAGMAKVVVKGGRGVGKSFYPNTH